MACVFSIDSMIRGYLEYKTVWDDPIDGEELECKPEIRNSYDMHTIVVRKSIDREEKIVGHVPRKLLTICLLFTKRTIQIGRR